MEILAVKRCRYREGDWFAVPLRDHGFALGRIARVSKRGRILLGYFFGLRTSHPLPLDDVRSHKPEEAVIVRQFGDLSLANGDWPIIGNSGDWERRAWPMPDFGRYVEGDSGAWRVHYPDEDPSSDPEETPIS